MAGQTYYGYFTQTSLIGVNGHIGVTFTAATIIIRNYSTLLNECIGINNVTNQLLVMSGSTSSYRDRIYIVEDIILKLVEYGELNQTALISFCGLNLKKHKSIIYELELNGLISKSETHTGKRIVTIYRPTQKGMQFCRSILEPYEKMFPRKKSAIE
jgi:predicted transcriptional regulator